ncbi:hypothetical protein [Burkholderia phage BCSR5]|nr:hypothetical protein [Burkholderia phage BCSR5]
MTSPKILQGLKDRLSPSSVRYGLPLEQPSKQTIIPIMIEPQNTCYGFFLLGPEVTFDGTETEYTLPSGYKIPLKSVTMPERGYDRSLYYTNTKQFMAAVYPAEEEKQAPWAGASEYVDQQSDQAYNYYQMPSETWTTQRAAGIITSSFRFGMNWYKLGDPVPPTPPVPGQDGTLYWRSETNYETFGKSCTWFDVNWVDLFQAETQVDPTATPGVVAAIPLNIEVKTIPPTGEFKVQVVRGIGGQSVVPGGGVVYNTLRFLAVKAVAPGDYDFTFVIHDDHGQTKDVKMKLTVTK